MLKIGQSQGFSRKEIEQLRSALATKFGHVASLTMVQWCQLLVDTLPDLAPEAERIFGVLDADGNGCLGLKELFHGLWILFHGSIREKISFIFEVNSCESS